VKEETVISTAEARGVIATRSRRVPSKALYWVAAVLLLLGMGGGVTWGVRGTVRTHDQARSLPRTSVPGDLHVSLEGRTSRLIFFEGGGKPSPEELGLTVTAPDGSSVPVRAYDLFMRYEIAGWAGAPIASFSAPASGSYTVSATTPGRTGRISVGDDFVRRQAIDVAGALALIGVTAIASLVIVVVVAARRASAVRAS
jgi:hypothetical protein